MEVTLHVDLLWTDLEDFVEHFERELRGANSKTLLGDDAGWRYWDDDPRPINPEFRGWEDFESGNYTTIRVASQGATNKTYWVLGGANGESETLRAITSVTRYRRDRLKLVVYEVEARGYAERLQQWLDDRWEDAVEPNTRSKAPLLSQNEPAPLLPVRAKPEDWFAWFDWYYRQAWGRHTSIEHMAQMLTM